MAELRYAAPRSDRANTLLTLVRFARAQHRSPHQLAVREGVRDLPLDPACETRAPHTGPPSSSPNPRASTEWMRCTQRPIVSQTDSRLPRYWAPGVPADQRWIDLAHRERAVPEPRVHHRTDELEDFVSSLCHAAAAGRGRPGLVSSGVCRFRFISSTASVSWVRLPQMWQPATARAPTCSHGPRALRTVLGGSPPHRTSVVAPTV